MIYRVPDNFPALVSVCTLASAAHGLCGNEPDRHATSHYDYFKNLIRGDDASAEAHRKFYDEYNAVLDMDADYYLETIKTVFQEYKLVHGTWDARSPEGKIERACVPRTSPPRRCSPWKVNWTTFQAPAKPRPPTTCAPAL